MAVSEAELSEGEFFTSLGMLIIQGRKWDGFRRSRGRGLHCPTVRNSAPPQHQCSPSNAECEAALSFRKAIQTIWQHGVTMMIDVILLPECGHQDTNLLLEKWSLQPTNENSTIPGLSLLQAIDSTIHFSQLCSWWSSTNGCQPRNIRYHVYECNNNPETDLKFSEPAINHNFMVSRGVKVRLQYLPRQKSIPELNCVCSDSIQQMEVGSPNRGRSIIHRGHRRGSRNSSASSDSLSPSVARVDVSPYGSPLLSPCIRQSLSSSSSSRGSSRNSSPCISRSPSENNVVMAFEAHRQVEELERRSFDSNSIVSRNDSGFIDNVSREGVTINRDEELANQLDSISDSDLSDDYIIDGPVGSPGLMGTPIASPDDVRVQMLQSTFAGWHCRHPTFDRLMSDEAGSRNRTRHSSLDSAVSNLERLDLQTRRQLSRTSSDGQNYADFRENAKDSEKEFFIRDIKKRHKTNMPESQDCTQHCSTPNNTFYASFRNESHPWQNECSTPFFYDSRDDFSLNFNNSQCSQAMNGTPTTVGFVTMSPRPLSLNLSQGQTECHDMFYGASFARDQTQDGRECPIVNFISNALKCTQKDTNEIEQSKIDETPNLRPQIQRHKTQIHKKPLSAKNLTSKLQQSSPLPSSENVLKDKVEDLDSASSSVLLRSPPSKLRILPKHCVDKNFLHNPTHQPVHKISASAQHGTARRLQFHQPTEKQICTSPAPIRRNNSVRFEFDEDMPKINQRSSRSICRGKCMKKNGLVAHNHTISAPTHRLLGSFEESIIHNRLEVLGSVDGFHAQLGASGSFCPAKVKLSVPVRFFHVSDDNAPSPYMGTMSLKGRECGKRGYHIPRKGTIQLTLFNPNNSVVKVFVILYDVSDMPPGHRTFLRHRIYSKPTAVDHNCNTIKTDVPNATQEKSRKNNEYLRYFVHLWLESSKTNKVYIHGDVKILFSLASNEWDSGNTFELHSETEFPRNPKYSSKR